MTLRDRRQFFATIERTMRAAGAKATPDGWYKYVISTPHGPLRIDWHRPERGNRGVWVFCRWDEPGRAPVACNPNTGKWNHYYTTSDAWREAAAHFLKLIDELLPAPVTA